MDVSYQSMTRVCSFFLSCSSEATALPLPAVPVVVVASAASVPAMFMSPASSSLTSSSLSLSLISIVTRRALRLKRAADTAVRDSLSSPGVRGPPRAEEREGVSSLGCCKNSATSPARRPTAFPPREESRIICQNLVLSLEFVEARTGWQDKTQNVQLYLSSRSLGLGC